MFTAKRFISPFEKYKVSITVLKKKREEVSSEHKVLQKCPSAISLHSGQMEVGMIDRPVLKKKEVLDPT